MPFFSRLSPIRAYKDLRGFLLQREPYELGFLALAVVVTGVFVYAFLRDGNDVKPVYRPQIQYVQQWTLDRTDAQIRAQQVIDQAAKDKRLKAEAEKRAALQAQFKRLDDRLKAYGI
ncbi:MULTISPECIES: hypothetical protein [unclassified Sphingomonas]|uniref:hypothetical protein n=1 Tax=unclassified Sphingomonas TaxID=196159 RepID=UPI001F55DEA1|nr:MULTISPECIES: hypothetical protein [unclassified Sphingomonas]